MSDKSIIPTWYRVSENKESERAQCENEYIVHYHPTVLHFVAYGVLSLVDHDLKVHGLASSTC